MPVSGRSGLLHLPSWLVVRLRVAPYFALRWPRRATDSAGCPASPVIWLCRRSSLELPRTSHPSAALGLGEPASCPAASPAPATPVDECRELPRRPHRPALPATDLRVASNLASFGGAEWPFCELPRWSVLRYRRRSGPWVTPASRIFRPRLMVSRVAPGLAPSGFAIGIDSGSRRSL